MRGPQELRGGLRGGRRRRQAPHQAVHPRVQAGERRLPRPAGTWRPQREVWGGKQMCGRLHTAERMPPAPVPRCQPNHRTRAPTCPAHALPPAPARCAPGTARSTPTLAWPSPRASACSSPATTAARLSARRTAPPSPPLPSLRPPAPRTTTPSAGAPAPLTRSPSRASAAAAAAAAAAWSGSCTPPPPRAPPPPPPAAGVLRRGRRADVPCRARPAATCISPVPTHPFPKPCLRRRTNGKTYSNECLARKEGKTRVRFSCKGRPDCAADCAAAKNRGCRCSAKPSKHATCARSGKVYSSECLLVSSAGR